MNIALDAMGGDFAPSAPVKGALAAISKSNNSLKVILVGNRNLIKKELGSSSPNQISIHHASEVVSMDDSGSKVIKSKPDSSMVQGIKLIKDGKADAFISAGSTGAQMATSLLMLGRIKHVKRPALGAYFSSLSGGKIICDIGANTDIKPQHLLQFAIMASVYLDHVEGVKNPKIGLINIGEEPSKGSELYQEAHKLLKEELPNFIGNIEGRNLFDSNANVIVCDGFVGNILIKFAEGWFSTFSDMVKKKILTKTRYKIGAQMIKPALEEIRSQYDYEEHGGAPLLGVNGISIVCHGSSTSKTIMNSIFLAEKSINESLISDISSGINSHLGPIV